MVDVYLNPVTNDLDIVNGVMRLTRSQEELTRQKIHITLSMNKGSWVFNINQGVPWLANDNNNVQLLGKVPIRTVDAAVKRAILTREGVISISSYQSTLNTQTRELTISFNALTETGEISVTTNINV